ncbi:metallophosphoesterase, partial [Klebsiella pneumoniae]|nr:metallophosphoesterase [Klebsiella pneumoniae]
AGERAYAIGDIHGRLDLFEALIAAIEADDARRNAALPQPARTSVILLGDLIDRGPHSAQVLARARVWQAALRERQAQ